tara:strand:+ start:4731 stop:5255 length:525 start_codon:yes stop_codon:yes gene_type:complete
VTDVLLASDADWLIQEVRSALSDPGTTVGVVRAGAEVRSAVAAEPPDLVILDLQIGNMGGMATCMDLRLEVGAGRLDPVPILMLLDRSADVFLAQQAGAEGWLVKPLDSFRLKMASVKLLSGGNMRDEVAESFEAEDTVDGFEPSVSDPENAGDGLDQPDDEEPTEAIEGSTRP